MNSKIFVFCFLACYLLQAQEKPKWFLQDYKNQKNWGFFCQGEAASEEESLKNAESHCASKICMLFGVEVSSSTVTEQTLTGLDVKNTVIEKCPNVRVVGRSLIRKNISCDEPKKCFAYIEQEYPISEYDKEYKRLDQPKISQVLEKQIIIREGNDTFKDPTVCRQNLKQYSDVDENDTVGRNKRIDWLKKSVESCKSLDYRNVNLQKELTGFISKNIEKKPSSSQMYLYREFEQTVGLENQIQFMLTFEERQLVLRKSEPKIKQILDDSFFYLFSKGMKVKDKKPLPDELEGVTTEELYNETYMREIYTCDKLKLIVRAWPGDWDDEIKTCGYNSEKSREDCEYLNVLRIRYQYMGCICRKNYQTLDQKCTEVFSRSLMKHCPRDFDSECQKKIVEDFSKSDFKKVIKDF